MAVSEVGKAMLEFKLVEQTLDNGLRVIVQEDHTTPVVSVHVMYHVGSKHERPGRTGFAHLFEHLMFQGSENVVEDAHFKYIQNAVTPTMIHVVEGDPRVPSPQSVELHMALKKLEVPTELFMYPGRSHGIPDPRNRLVKAVSEMAWMDYYVRGIGENFQWRQVLETLESEERPTVVSQR